MGRGACGFARLEWSDAGARGGRGFLGHPCWEK